MHAHALDQDGAFNGSPEDEDTARRTRSSEASRDASSLLKKPPGEGTGPTMHAVFRGNLVGRVPSRGERHVVQQTARRWKRPCAAGGCDETRPLRLFK